MYDFDQVPGPSLWELYEAFKDIDLESLESADTKRLDDIFARLNLAPLVAPDDKWLKGFGQFKIYEEAWNGWWDRIGSDGPYDIYSITQDKPSTGEHLTGEGKVLIGPARDPFGNYVRGLYAEKYRSSDGNRCKYTMYERPYLGNSIQFVGTYNCLNGSGMPCTFIPH